jgi:PAS domain S-box-containing protein
VPKLLEKIDHMYDTRVWFGLRKIHFITLCLCLVSTIVVYDLLCAFFELPHLRLNSCHGGSLSTSTAICLLLNVVAIHAFIYKVKVVFLMGSFVSLIIVMYTQAGYFSEYGGVMSPATALSITFISASSLMFFWRKWEKLASALLVFVWMLSYYIIILNMLKFGEDDVLSFFSHSSLTTALSALLLASAGLLLPERSIFIFFHLQSLRITIMQKFNVTVLLYVIIILGIIISWFLGEYDIHSKLSLSVLSISYPCMVLIIILTLSRVVYIATTQSENSFNQLKQLQLAIDDSAIVARTDISGKIIYVNEMFEKISGYSKEELIGRDHRVINSGHHDKAFFIDLWRTISSGNVWRGRICNRNKNGYNYWVDTTISPVCNDQNEIIEYLAIRHDITDIEKQKLLIRHERDRALLSDRAKTEFLSNMSHELMTPLNAIIGFSDYLKTKVDDAEIQDSLNNIHKAGGQLHLILSDAILLASLNSEKMDQNVRPISLHDFFNRICLAFEGKIKAKGLQFISSYEFDTELGLVINEEHLERIVTNLLDNALKFTKSGSIRFEINGDVKNDGFVRSLAFHVIDTGIGIEPADFKKIFIDFVQLDGSMTRNYAGSGLGLSLAKKLANFYGGQIYVDSRLNEGSRFTLHFDQLALSEIIDIDSDLIF